MITQDLLKKFDTRFKENKANDASRHAISEVGINKASLNGEVKRDHSFTFSQDLKTGKATNQNQSGRCWMYAALNTARNNTMDILNVDNFEYSQNYTLFWDKLEQANYFLNNIIETADEPLESRLVWHLLQSPCEDGGQWEMFADILRKYGCPPKEAMPETYNSKNTSQLNTVLNNKLREDACILRKMHEEGKSDDELRQKRDEQLYFVYNVLVKALGEVPTVFTYEYRDKDNKFHQIESITPQDFFKNYSGIDLDDMVTVINSPTEDKPFHKTYTVKFLGCIEEGKPVKYLNLPIEELKKAAVASIEDGHAVWFGADITQMSNSKLGIMDTGIYDYESTLGETGHLTKGERLDYSVSLLTHAMVLTGVDLNIQGKPKYWKVENSWGDKVGDKGIFSMSDEWFSEYVYQISLPSKYLDHQFVEEYQQDPIELAPWDPMGSLAWLR